MINMDRHRFIIGIGSQRAGSTLLHRLLDVSSDVFMHPVKELHYFDTLYGYRAHQSLQEFSMRQLVREVDRIVASKDLGFVKNNRYRCYLRTNRLLSRLPIEKVNYLDLFRPNLKAHSLLGEVTPEYMLLDEESIKKMRDVVGEDAGIILICRDPVKRLLSAVKLMNAYNNLQMDDDAANEWLSRMLDSDNHWIKVQDKYNDYGLAIEKYSKYFSKIFVVTYEKLISNPGAVAKKLGSVLGINIDENSFEYGIKNVFNDLGKGFSLSGENMEKIEKRYFTASSLYKNI